MQGLFEKKNVRQYKQQLVIGMVTPEDKCDGGDLKQVVIVHQLADQIHIGTAGGISIRFLPAFLLHTTAAGTAAMLTSAGFSTFAGIVVMVMYGCVEVGGRAGF